MFALEAPFLGIESIHKAKAFLLMRSRFLLVEKGLCGISETKYELYGI